jgi:hypothetical protein
MKNLTSSFFRQVATGAIESGEKEGNIPVGLFDKNAVMWYNSVCKTKISLL